MRRVIACKFDESWASLEKAASNVSQANVKENFFLCGAICIWFSLYSTHQRADGKALNSLELGPSSYHC
jgi:hypothetical protein